MKRLELVIANGPLAGRRFEVKPEGIRLGRSSSNDIHLSDEQLSRNHCLFETVGECGVRVTDLASANGTLVNGVPLGSDPVELKAGDLVEVGETVVRVVGEQQTFSDGSVDLGLGAKERDAAFAAPRHRSLLVNVLWIVAVLLSVAAILVVLTVPREEPTSALTAIHDEAPKIVEVWYEKVEATLEGICRYEMSVSRDGTIRVSLDDTKENRHPTILPKTLDETAKAELDSILAYELLKDIDHEYAGPEPEPQALNSWMLRVVYTTCARGIKIVNTQEPEAFRSLREKLEAFANNELGIHAIRYSREKLIQMAEEQIAVGRAKWEDRDVQHGNLFGAVAAYKEAIFYLNTVDPKPECIREARTGLESATAELDRRYGDQRFVVDRAINLGDWESAQRELLVLLEMIPDRRDDRNREASTKLVDVEKRMRGGK